MIIVGELINSTRKAIRGFVEAKDEEAIKKVAMDQFEAGADYIDVNAGVFPGKEADYLTWLTETVQSVVDGPCTIDSPDPKAIEAALAVHKGTAMINSISAEKDRYDSLVPVVAGTDLKVVALCMDDKGMPETAEQRLAIAEKLINGLVKNNVSIDNIYVDPLVQPISTNDSFGKEFLKAIGLIMAEFEGVHTVAGLSNISFGLPNRKYLNQQFMPMAVALGLDAAIINPLDQQMMASIYASNALAGNDSFCMKYLKAHRAEMFN